MWFKKLLRIVAIISFIALIAPLQSNAMKVNAASMTAISPSDSAADSKVAAQIMQRVNEIQAMDKSDLSPDEKRALRKELKGLKQKADGLDSKVYLSVGAIIIIILILILVLR